MVFTLPAAIADIAYQNKTAIYGILFTASAETMTTIAADPKHLGARIGITVVLHTWGSAMTHHPHVHMIVPGGGISADGSRWISSRPDFLVHVADRCCGTLDRARSDVVDRENSSATRFQWAAAGIFGSAPMKREGGEWVVAPLLPTGGGASGPLPRCRCRLQDR